MKNGGEESVKIGGKCRLDTINPLQNIRESSQESHEGGPTYPLNLVDKCALL